MHGWDHPLTLRKFVLSLNRVLRKLFDEGIIAIADPDQRIGHYLRYPNPPDRQPRIDGVGGNNLFLKPRLGRNQKSCSRTVIIPSTPKARRRPPIINASVTPCAA